MTPPWKVAIALPEITGGGGVPALAAFLFRSLLASGRYEPELISLATSAGDRASVRLTSPRSWFRNIEAEDGTWDGKPYRHMGAFFTEFEFQRYRPRAKLTELFNRYDLVQIVAGTPAWALVAANVQRPVVLQVATLAQLERTSALAAGSGPQAIWRRLMARVTARLDVVGLQRSDAVFVINTGMMERLLPWCPPEKLIFLPPGVDTDHFRPADLVTPGYILAVGRLDDPRKNVRMLFEAYSLLRRTIPDAPRLLLVGQSIPSQADLQAAERLGVAEYVDLRRDVTHVELARLYRGAALFVLSSNEEGLGIVILEAMASGLPVVSTRCGGPETTVVHGETGFLVPVGDAPAMAAKMQDVLSSPVLRTCMGKRGRTRVVEQFSLAAMGRKVVECYDQMLGGSATGP